MAAGLALVLAFVMGGLAGCDAEVPSWAHLASDTGSFGGAGSFAGAGCFEGGRSRVVLEELAADGLELGAGERRTVESRVPPRSGLRVTLVARSGQEARVRFRVALDGRDVLDQTLDVDAQGTSEAFVLVPLPPEGSSAARLEFRVDGAADRAAFLNPVIGPLAIGTAADRPWGKRAPDVLLLVADTFRADLLAAWDGPVFGTPHLNALAARGTRFLHSRSVATWTLPATVSLLTGLFPTQHGALADDRASAPALATLAQRLRAAGYRTGAITDAGYVSRHYGLDRGFEWFREHARIDQQRIGRTLDEARTFLARDDGRPTFLFVHTYRTHWPYRTGEEESSARHQVLVRAFEDRLEPGLEDERRAEPSALEPFARGLLELYRDAARDLDTALGPWFEELEHARFFDHGLFVFTSDHGEAFFEHGKNEHRGLPFEEEIRVPLFVVGAGVAAREEAAPVSTVDLVPSLAARCGLDFDPSWVGRSWQALDPGRATFAWHGEGERGALALVQGGRKVFALPSSEALARGAARAAFDLALDPLEHADQVSAGQPWPADLARDCAPSFAPFETLQAPALPVEIAPGLESLGYGRR